MNTPRQKVNIPEQEPEEQPQQSPAQLPERKLPPLLSNQPRTEEDIDEDYEDGPRMKGDQAIH